MASDCMSNTAYQFSYLQWEDRRWLNVTSLVLCPHRYTWACCYAPEKSPDEIRWGKWPIHDQDHKTLTCGPRLAGHWSSHRMSLEHSCTHSFMPCLRRLPSKSRIEECRGRQRSPRSWTHVLPALPGHCSRDDDRALFPNKEHHC